MKNLQTDISDEKGSKITYAGLIQIVLRAGPQATQSKPGGLTPGEMLDRLPLLDKVKDTKLDEEFGFSADQIVTLRNIWENHRWVGMSDEVIAITKLLKEEAEKPRKEK